LCGPAPLSHKTRIFFPTPAKYFPFSPNPLGIIGRPSPSRAGSSSFRKGPQPHFLLTRATPPFPGSYPPIHANVPRLFARKGHKPPLQRPAFLPSSEKRELVPAKQVTDSPLFTPLPPFFFFSHREVIKGCDSLSLRVHPFAVAFPQSVDDGQNKHNFFPSMFHPPLK